MIDFEKILTDLEAINGRKREIALVKAQAEVDKINKEHEAYLDGLYDAGKVIKCYYEKEQKDGNT